MAQLFSDSLLMIPERATCSGSAHPQRKVAASNRTLLAAALTPLIVALVFLARPGIWRV